MIDVAKQYVGIIVGKERKNLKRIERKTRTEIKLPFRHDAEGRLKCKYKFSNNSESFTHHLNMATELDVSNPPTDLCLKRRILLHYLGSDFKM